MINKFFWAFRALVCKVFMKSIKMPSYIGKPLYINKLKNVQCGKRVRIYPGIRIDNLEKSKIIIGNNVSIGQNVHLVSYKKDLYIGNDVTISANVFISNCDHRYDDISKSVLEQDIIEKDTVINDGCFIGYGSVIQAGTTLGKHCVVGSNSVVKGNFPDYTVIAGVPAKIIKKYDDKEKIWKKVSCEEI